MDFLSPVLGSITGIEPAQWKVVFIFALKVFLFTLPFVALGLLLEKDIRTVPMSRKMVKSLVVLLFCLPPFLFGILNYAAPRLSQEFWEKYPLLESFWIMEGSLTPLLLSALASLFALLYIAEVMRGELRN
ncbi:MAG: hypothetical protein JSV00_09840 [bacterium]|nr:MAG: hypothetical protein JSV00_09840 [bacterium]